MPIQDEGLLPYLARLVFGKSWATTVAGLGVAIPLALPEVEKAFDGDPLTNPNWFLVVSGVFAAIFGRVARTDWVTSEGTTAVRTTPAAPKTPDTSGPA